MKKTYKIVKKSLDKTEFDSSKWEILNEIKRIKEKYNVDEQFLIELISKKELVPVSIFKGNLTPLEALATYLLEEEKLSLNEVAERLNRSYTTIHTTYRKALKKEVELDISYDIFIPLEDFRKEKLSILETVVLYLREKGMKLKRISDILNKHPNTIQTCYGRALRKGGGSFG